MTMTATTNETSGTDNTQTKISRRRLCYAIASSTLGAWAFCKFNSISGPAFEPVLKACTDPNITVADFAQKTGYHAYEPKVGFGIFKVFVCLVTQVLLELRETPTPAGLLTWGVLVLVSLPLNVAMVVSAGRRGAIGPVRFPTILGLLSQTLGVSVIIPLVYVPSYIYSRTEMGVPVSNVRILCGAYFALPLVMLSAVVFYAPTSGYLWTISAGMLGGPVLAMMSLLLWNDKSSSMDANPSVISKSASNIQWAYSLMEMVSFFIWMGLVGIIYWTYGLFSFADIWRDIWVEATPCVALMAVDGGVLYIGVLLYISYHNEWKAVMAICLTPFIGPGAACCRALAGLEDEAATSYSRSIAKKKQ